jgi:hypothetical protein
MRLSTAASTASTGDIHNVVPQMGDVLEKDRAYNGVRKREWKRMLLSTIFVTLLAFIFGLAFR